MNFIKRTVTLLNFFTHYKLATSLVLLGAIGLVVSCSLLHIDPTERQEFTVCMTDALTPEDCKKSLHVSVLKTANPYRYVPDFEPYFAAEFTVFLPKHEKMLSYVDKSKSDVDISFWQEPFSARYARFARTGDFGSGFGYPIQRTVGSLITIKESAPGEDGSELLVPGDGDVSIFFKCVKPFRAIAGNLVTNVGCQVHTLLQPDVFLQYGIKRAYLQDWKKINEEVLTQIRSVVTIQ